tara:strand:- start:5553 stop:6692 length:1140 start_codon:yes stop_codon:yes gene_type:complete
MPGLLDKMYDDGKYASKERQKKKEEEVKKAEREKKRIASENIRKKKALNARKNKKGKPLTTNEKLAYSCLAIIIIPFIQLFFIYNSGSWLDIILKSTKNSNFLKESLPDGDGLPYGKGEQGAGIKCKEIKALLPEKDYSKTQPIDGISKPGQVGGKKRYKQKGGFNNDVNDKKDFFDTTKLAFPYTLIENDNFLMRGIGNYFKTFWQCHRGALKMLLESVNESIFKDHKEPTGLGEQVYDILKFVVVLPVVSILAIIGQNIMSFGLLFWGSFNNQTLLIPLLFLFALGCIFLGGIGGYFWPWGLFSIYLTVFTLKPNPQKLDNFRNYGKKYKWLWAFSIAAMWAISIGAIWDWHKDAMIFIGIICALFGLGMLGISNLV